LASLGLAHWIASNLVYKNIKVTFTTWICTQPIEFDPFILSHFSSWPFPGRTPLGHRFKQNSQARTYVESSSGIPVTCLFSTVRLLWCGKIDRMLGEPQLGECSIKLEGCQYCGRRDVIHPAGVTGPWDTLSVQKQLVPFSSLETLGPWDTLVNLLKKCIEW
jgi:hypothetical protein